MAITPHELMCHSHKWGGVFTLSIKVHAWTDKDLLRCHKGGENLEGVSGNYAGYYDSDTIPFKQIHECSTTVICCYDSLVYGVLFYVHNTPPRCVSEWQGSMATSILHQRGHPRQQVIV